MALVVLYSVICSDFCPAHVIGRRLVGGSLVGCCGAPLVGSSSHEPAHKQLPNCDTTSHHGSIQHHLPEFNTPSLFCVSFAALSLCALIVPFPARALAPLPASVDYCTHYPTSPQLPLARQLLPFIGTQLGFITLLPPADCATDHSSALWC
jgi:hypothetical protein